MSANFTPDMTGYKGLSPFRFWCQKTLPLVYDDSLSYYELLCKVVNYINNLITDVAAAEDNVDKLLTAYNQLQEYVNNYFDGEDFQQKIDDSLDRYAEDGTLSSMVNTHVSALLPYEVGQQIGPVVDEDLGPVVDLKLPAVVESKIAAPVATQLPAVVQNQIGGVVGNQIGDVVADQIDEVVADQITDAVSPLVHDEVTGLIRPAVSAELPAALQVYLPPEVQTQLPGAIGTDLENIAPPVIEDWLDAHPEATTSVPDGSISFSKLATDLQRRAGIIGTYFPSDFTNEYVWQVNQYAVYQGIVYRCIKTTTVGQAWNASEWTTANMNSDLFYMWWCLNYLSQSITTIDSSPATTAHEAGEYFIYYDGAHLYRLAKASSNIAVGDTLTPNGNFIYSSVANMIADLKVEIADLKSAIISDIASSIVFEHGGINGTTGADSDPESTKNYARCGYIYVDSAVDVSIDHSVHSTYRIYVYYYNASKAYQGTSGIEYDFSLTNFTGYIRVALRDTNISVLTDADIATLQSALHITYNNATKSIYALNTEIIKTQSEISARIAYDVETGRPYNLLTGTIFYPNKYVNQSSGELTSSVSGEYASDYIPIDASQGYICKNTDVYNFYYDVSTGTYHQTYDNSFTRYQFAFYDINKTFIPYTGAFNDTSAEIPQNARFIRVTLSSEAAIKTSRLIYGNYQSKPNLRQVAPELKPIDQYVYKPKTGYESFNMVMFGDSITHGDLFIDNDGVSYVDYAGDFLGANIMNVGFGGTRMALAPNQSISGAYLFAFFNLCDVIVSDAANKWDALDAYISTNATYGPHLDRLKAINWNTVHAIGIMYGANDYMSNTPVGTEYNTDYNKFDGACAYGLNKLLTKYPHLQVIIFTPFYRQPNDGDIATDTDNATNSAGLSMADYGKSLRNVSDVVHCPVIDTYHTIQINKYNKPLLMKDGTHPRTTLACKRMGQYFAEQIKQWVYPLI